MAINQIDIEKRYLPLITAKYVQDAKTSVLETDDVFEQYGSEYFVRNIETEGLGDFDKYGEQAYPHGAVKSTLEPITPESERGKAFYIDRKDEERSGNLLMKYAKRFLEAHVTPEVDATRLSKIASTDGVVKVAESIETGEQAIASLRKCKTYEDNTEVANEIILFANANITGLIDDLDTTKSTKVLSRFGGRQAVIEIPEKRFWTAIEKLSGRDGEESGYKKADGAHAINYIAVPKGSVVAKTIIDMKVLGPEIQEKDGYTFPFRVENIIKVLDDYAEGVYVSYAPTAE